MHHAPPPPLLDTYLARRGELLRFFTRRLRSAEAADDLVQEIYLKVAAGAGGEAVQPAAFLYRLGSNLMLDRIRQERRSAARDDAWRMTETTTRGGQDVAREPAADQAVAARQRLEQLVAALNALSPACRRAFRLHKFEGLSHAQVAEVMGMSRSGVEKHISHALRQLLEKVGR